MSRYIDAESLTAEFHRLTFGENSLIERLFADGVYAVIDTFPTADVVPVVHAYWIEHKNAEEKYNRLIPNYECSNCHTWKEEKTRFCPDCGAKMDEEGKEKKNEQV